jgi:hypothetical protein
MGFLIHHEQQLLKKTHKVGPKVKSFLSKDDIETWKYCNTFDILA